jgi:Peptidase A4 family
MGARPAFYGRGHIENSPNWSGVYVKPGPRARFNWVGGAWTVPEPDIPLVTPIDPGPDDPFRNEYRSSVWIGLDGHRAYPHVTMPQIGTQQFLKTVNGQKVYTLEAWFQWWSRDQQTATQIITNVPIKIGDRILAAISVVSSDEVIFYIKNQSTGLFAWGLAQAPHQAEPLGTTAQWIVERPTWPTSIFPSRMPKINDVNFTHCLALASERLIGPRTLHRLENARFIRMQDRFTAPYRSALICIPERTSPTTARVRYREAHVSQP